MSSPATPKGELIFQSKRGYSIAVPLEMHQVTTTRPQQDLILNDEDMPGTVVTILVIRGQPDTVLDKVMLDTRTKFAVKFRDAGYKVLREGTLVLDGSPALTFTSSFNLNDSAGKPHAARMQIVITCHDGKVYVLSYGGAASRFKGHLDSFEQSLTSLRWTK